MSHVKNVVSYSRLVDICTGYGGTYNPGHQTLQLKAMRALLKEAQSSLQDVSQKTNAFNSMTNERAQAFQTLPTLVARIVGTLQAVQVPESTLADARYFFRLITGRLATPRIPVPSEDNEARSVKTRSFTQQSYVAKAHNFFKLVQMVQEVPNYVTNESDLQVPALMETAGTLNGLNESWSKAKVALSNARIHRNKVLYKGVDAVINNASAVKSYVKVAFGTRSGQSAQLKDVSFTKPKIR